MSVTCLLREYSINNIFFKINKNEMCLKSVAAFDYVDKSKICVKILLYKNVRLNIIFKIYNNIKLC